MNHDPPQRERDTDPDIRPDQLDTVSAPPTAPDAPKDTIPADGPDPMIGTLLDGRYLLLGLLGEGGMGHVYRANHVLMDKPVAVKLIHAELAHVEDVAKRFEQEAKSSSRLTDPHCITVTDFGRTEDGTLFLVMELLEGEELDERVERSGALSTQEALRITTQILKGLIHAHEQGVVHRDLKPENVFLVEHGDEKDFVKILDFGIAKLASGGGISAENLTKSGIVFGTPKYLSPEQALGDKVDHRADLYAVGIILYEMLTGSPPYIAETAMDTLTMHLTADPPTLSDAGAFPRGLQGILDRALEKKPEDRFASANEFLAAVEAIDPEGDPPSGVYEVFSKLSGRRSSTTIAAPRARRKRRNIQVFIGIGILLLIGAILFVVLGGNNEQSLDAAAPVGDKPDELAGQPAKVKALLDKAKTQLRNDRAADAVETAKKALEKEPGLSVAHLILGHALFQSEERVEAMVSYENALASNKDLASDPIFKENVKAALESKNARPKAALMMARYGGDEAIEFLKGLANSPLTEGSVRRDSRSALVETGHEKQVDWVTSLTADFHDLKKCRQRIEIINQMKDTGDPSFLPLLEEYKPVPIKPKRSKKKGKKKKKKKPKTTNPCIGETVLAAIAALNPKAKDKGR